MRKILSLTLVAVMLLSTLMLTSCSSITDFFNGLLGKEEPVRTTITEMEWRNAYKNKNYTLEFEDGDIKADIVVCKSLVKILFKSYNVAGVSLDDIAVVFDLENKLILCETSIGWIAQDSEDLSLDLSDIFKNNQFHLGAIQGLPDVDFDELVYEEQTKSYIAKDKATLADCYFENGLLVSVTLESVDTTKNISMKITNIGTSVIDAPASYENLSDKNVLAHTADANTRTTVTASEFANNKNINNSTIYVYTSDMSALIEVVMRQNSKANETSICVAKKEMLNQKAIVINGYLYDLTKTNGKYVATNTYSTQTSAVGELLGSINFSDLIYDSANGYYKYANLTTKGYFYFENGNLVKAVAVTNNSKTVTFITNINSTEIDIPAYTVQ